ncbi:hypothetical protein EW026_g4471 [Hermanssonia centrifuga]|uniref:Cytochrome P450 n=1 Tax=Hermanssonia centrifuga TaxID=98765 RepID=A0A4S4KI39_9APHY|nr:hypothetical protein EW026_g4471 [Hermanssonia centrifuga]
MPILTFNHEPDDLKSYTRGSVAVSIFEQFPGHFTPVATEGAAWRASRKSIQPIFAVKSFQDHLVSAMDEIVPTCLSLLRNVAKNNVALDWNDLAGRIALSIFCKTAFDVDTRMLREDVRCLDEQDVFIGAVLELNEISAARLFNPYWSLTERFDGTKSHFDKNISRLWAAIEALIAEHSDRKRSQDNLNEKTDFLTSLIQGHFEENPVFLRNIMVTLLFGGRDNTQNSISWAMYELSRHPQWLTRMRKEAKELDKAGSMPTFANVSSYIVHLAVFYETLRLWPGLPKNARYAIVDDVLPAVPDFGLPEVPISKGTYVLWSDRIIMRDPTVYGEDATEFNPGRHISPEGKFIKPSLPEFISFGAGPRYCPAATIVPYEWVCIWSALLRDFDFEALDLSERTVGDTLTNQMEKPFMVRVRPLDKQEQLEY